MQELINKYKEKYPEYNGDNGSIESLIYMLCTHILGIEITKIKLNPLEYSKNVDRNILDRYAKQIFEKHIPIQYVIGKAYVYNEEYIVTDNVLIPRQDTEVLIEESINCINANNFTSLLDLCTGSGAVGISISKNSNIKTCILLDISSEALAVAERNIDLNSANKCKVVLSDMFQNILNEKVDILVANPPYITDNEMEDLSAYVKAEPEIALRAGKDGLDYYRKIYKEAPNVLNNEAYILVEIGYMQADGVKKIIEDSYVYDNIRVVKDMNGKDRVVMCHFHRI